ncbi:CYTH and CHAD domain-containing protein [Roseomonas sp. NAR14]|uniref:CYTH and CHAD domain-containing protein n=1 Tax=Roseomonas acroporae TaxID=2937791 RepID=A0A9X1YB32_9PROT|nr:CYTH and CHAD domain-containing protein [Roseomonas acroporae]MCK8786430.1 CYTH and CHAD domain-containing protein [Roseomonas acroporae]
MGRKHDGAGPVEIEVSFRLPEGAEAALATLPAFQPPLAAPAEAVRARTTYFDTPDRLLLRHRLALRIRRSGRQRVQTVKSGAAGPGGFGRGEWEAPVARDRPDPAAFAGTPLAALDLDSSGRALADRLEPVFTTEIDRRRQLLHLPDGTVVEAALDTGVIRAGASSRPVRELELELKQGSPAALFRLALEIHAVVPLAIEAESKAARGYRLLAGTAPAAEPAPAPARDPSARSGAAFAAMLGNGLRHLLANLPAAMAGGLEGVHQLRVALRRLRTVLALFREAAEPSAAAAFDAGLRRAGRVFGEARDWDVFCAELLPEAITSVAEPAAAEALRRLRTDAERAREQAHAALRAELEGPAFTALVLGLAAWAEEGRALGGERRKPLARLLPDRLRRLARRARRRARHLGRRSDAELHGLRRSVRKLRFAAELGAAPFRPKRVKRYRRATKALLAPLGMLNDAGMALRLAGTLEAGEPARHEAARAALARWAEARRATALARLPEARDAFRNARAFWD